MAQKISQLPSGIPEVTDRIWFENADGNPRAVSLADLAGVIAPGLNLTAYVKRDGTSLLTGPLVSQTGNPGTGLSTSVLEFYTDDASNKASLRALRGTTGTSTGIVLRTKNAGSDVDALTLGTDGMGVFANSLRITSPSANPARAILANSANAATPLVLYQGFSSATAGDGALVNIANADIVFGTNNAERGRIKADGALRWGNEVQSTSANAFRMVQGNYGVFLRQDGASLYLLSTASGDQYGTWSTPRPLTVDIATGKVSHGNGVDIAGNLSMAGNVFMDATSVERDIGWTLPGRSAYFFGNTTGLVGLYDSVGSFRWRSTTDNDFIVGRHLFAKDLIADRGDGTGVVFLNGAQSRYLFFDGTRYVMPSAGLVVNGGPVLTSESGTLRIEGQARAYNRWMTLAANGAAWVEQARTFVTSGDPGAQAQDGDLWIW